MYILSRNLYPTRRLLAKPDGSFFLFGPRGTKSTWLRAEAQLGGH